MILLVITMLLKLVAALVFLFILPYLFYYNVFMFYRKKWFYEGQDIVFTVKEGTGRMLPMLGSIPAMIDCIKSTEERKTNKAIISEYYDKYIGEWKAGKQHGVGTYISKDG